MDALLPCGPMPVTDERAHSQGAFGLPFGLLMVLVCGGELFTGNTALVTVAVRPRCSVLAVRTGGSALSEKTRPCTRCHQCASVSDFADCTWCIFRHQRKSAD